MVKSVFIARKSDGLVFCELSDEISQDRNLMSIRNKAIEFLKNLQEKEGMHSVNIGSQNFMFRYMISENLVYLVITDVKYPTKLAFDFLEEIQEGFLDELKNHFGTQSVSYYSKLETIDRSNYFMKFGKIQNLFIERFIKKKKGEYAEGGSKGNIELLNQEITDLHKIMTENINLMLDRENSLINIDTMSTQMTDDTAKFKNKAIQTRYKLLLAKYSVFIAIGAILLLFIIFKFYF